MSVDSASVESPNQAEARQDTVEPSVQAAAGLPQESVLVLPQAGSGGSNHPTTQ